MQLPSKQSVPQMQSQWKSILDPALANLLLQGQLISGVSLVNGTTVVNHKLGRKLIGWVIVGIDAAATVHDSQASNQTPQSTLVLVSNAVAKCNLWVF